MSHLFQALAERVDDWRASRYDCPAFPTLHETRFPVKSARRAAMGLNAKQLTKLIADTSLEEVTELLETDKAFVRKRWLDRHAG